ncbi:low temperature requirement protein LtrA [Motilibacter peucedani]|uniref:Low temperature requirement protein LtrA n=1 Tax=Motilibacter peucedani TaxID=598650 RepID=A0A420XTG1_9ACTN|nr:low temperature requirement protein A [Motilibacter peucedani]RKS79959.1 low temperature requirement protein LtrA [Motilibacter peucedani]
MQEDVRRQLFDELRHRLRPMRGRDPRERGRSSTPLELLYDLTYVVAFGAAADQLATHLSDGHVAAALGAYAFAVFSISWAWMSFTWFASAYSNDDVVLRLATLVQMVGVVVLTFGLPVSADDAAQGDSPNNPLMLTGYVVMRLPLVALWLRAARADPAHARTCTGYAATIVVAQAAWAATVLLPLPLALTVAALVLLAVAEMTVPVLLEERRGRLPWNAGHLAERFSLLTLITLGEVVAATVSAVSALVGEQGWSVGAVVVVASGLVLTASLWWAYFLIPSRVVLEQLPERTFAWRYAHLPMFGSIAAVGAGLRVAAEGVESGELSLGHLTLAMAVPVVCVLVMVFATWSVLMSSYDLTHLPLFAVALAPSAAAVVLAWATGFDRRVKTGDGASVTLLVLVVALIASSAVVEVVGHEVVAYGHTVRALEEQVS